jgi:hypothetical protein
MAKTPLLRRLAHFIHGLDGDNFILREQIARAEAVVSDDDPCVACDDDHKQGWYDQGFSEAERVAFCQLLGCLPPNEG